MELWIRSQDKTTLIRSYEIYIAEYGKDSYVIRAKRTSHILGAYNSFERALEVLDEIQSILLPNIKLITRNYTDEELKECSIKDLVMPPIEDVKIQELSTYVYEMPKDLIYLRR